ncbi:MAG: hypothetical protein U5J99_03525 [Parvularculaceae bacterium]|nr:hypothetical protein [Parvularculaceae bacterium]
MRLFVSAEVKARKEREAVEEAARVQSMRARAGARIEALKTRSATAPSRLMDQEQRRWPRTPALNVASAMFDTGGEATVRVLDCSFGGMRVEFLDDRERPNEFALTVPSLRFVGIVKKAWSAGSQAGVEVVRWQEPA